MESDSRGWTPPLVNNKTPLATTASNSLTPLEYIVCHMVGKLTPSWAIEAATRTWCIIPGRAEEGLRAVSEGHEEEEASSVLTMGV